ncbi:MAG: glycosyltransferase family 39 protein [Anaerolineae bacterium]
MSKLPRVWPPLALTLLAFAIRLHNLTYHSLWFDEAMSVHWARSSVPRILEVSMNLVEDRLPPLYYLSLHYWRLWVGDGEVAVRLPSVLLGTLLIPLIYRLAADLLAGSYGRRVALLAAALAALNPFLVWYSQEARMYAQAVLLSSLGTWLFLRAVASTHSQDDRKATFNHAFTWLAYGLCLVAGLYTHLYTGFLLPSHALYLLLTWRWSRRAWLPFAATMLVVALSFTPLALAAWRASSEAGAGDPLAHAWGRLWRLLSAFSVWKAPLPAGCRSAITALIAAFAAAGFLWPFWRTRPGSRHPHLERPVLLVALLLFMPIVIATLLLFRNQLAFLGERYFIVSVPWLLISVAAGAVRLAAHWRGAAASTRQHLLVTRYPLSAACYLLPIVLTIIPLPGQWSPPARKEAWRETADYLATYARPEHAILIHPDWTRYPLQYYFRGPGQTYAIFGSVEEDSDLDSPLTVISSKHPLIWLVESHTELADPDHQVSAWLAARYPGVTELYPPGLVAVRAYAPGYLTDAIPDYATPVRVPFAGGLELIGYSIPETRVQATDDLFHPPSGWVHVTLYWGAGAPPGGDYTPFVHLVDDLGQVWGASLERPNDAFDFYPPTRWEPGQVVRSDFDVNLNPITPPGSYTLVVGLRDTSGMQIPLVDGLPQAPLTSIEIVGSVSNSR